MERHEPGQLNTPAVPETHELEEILREFAHEGKKSVSGDTMTFRPIKVPPPKPQMDAPMKVMPSGKLARPKHAPAPVNDEETVSVTAPQPSIRTPVPPPAVSAEAEDSAVPVKKKKPPRAPKTKPEASKPPRPAKGDAPKKAAAPPSAPHNEPTPAPTPREAYARHQRGLLFLRLRVCLLGLAALVGVFLLLYDSEGWAFLPFLPQRSYGVSVAALILTALLAAEVPLRGIADLFRLRPSLYTLSLPVLVLTLLYSLREQTEGYCAVTVLLLFCLLYALLKEKSALCHTLRTVCSFDAPMGIYDAPQLLPNTDSLRRDTGDLEDYMRRLEKPDFPTKLLCIYSCILLPLTGGLAYFLGGNFVQSWLLLLLSAIPCSGMLSYWRPFAHLAKRLSGFGGALCGWHGARIYGGRHTIILRDEDLFPRSNLSSNGMKLFGSIAPGRVISYALAALVEVDSPLTDLFEQLLQSQYGKHAHATSVRIYDSGGIGAEIMGDVVLVGSLAFMRSMGVHMPEGTRVRQAVYVSVEGSLAGVFAVKYKANASTRSGLRDVLSNRNFSVVLATRDFLITPELLAAKYELPMDDIRLPTYTERLRLSQSDSNERGAQGALIAKDTFGAFASTVAAGRTLRICALFSLALALMAGVIGLLLCLALLLWNTGGTEPVHFASFQLLWAFVTWFVSLILLKL